MQLFIILFATVASFSHKDAYVISIDHYSTISGANVREIVSAAKRIQNKGIWVRRGGREYVIDDEKTHREVLALFAPQMALEPEQRAVSEEERRLDHEIDHLEDQDDRPLTAAERERLSDLRAQMKVISRRERELDEREEELERVAERQFWTLVDSTIRSGLAKPLTR